MEYHTTTDFKKGPDDILIFDESDHFLFGDSAGFIAFVGACRCLCLTATPGGKDNTLETDIITHMKFRTLQDQGSQPCLAVDKEVDAEALVEFVHGQRRPVLIYCDEQSAASYHAQFPNSVASNDVLAALAKLQEQTDCRFPVLIVTAKELMRAVDYRAEELGITLVIARPF